MYVKKDVNKELFPKAYTLSNGKIGGIISFQVALKGCRSILKDFQKYEFNQLPERLEEIQNIGNKITFPLALSIFQYGSIHPTKSLCPIN